MKNRLIKSLQYFKKINLKKLIGFIVVLVLAFSMSFLLHLSDANSALTYINSVNNQVTTNFDIFGQFGNLFNSVSSLTQQASTANASTTGVINEDFFNIFKNSDNIRQSYFEFRNFLIDFNNFVHQRFNELNKFFNELIILSLSIYEAVKVFSFNNEKKECSFNQKRVEMLLETPNKEYQSHFTKCAFLSTCHLTC